MISRFTITLPGWLDDIIDRGPTTFISAEQRVRWVADLARLNVHHGTGGPFGAAVFDCVDHSLVAVGVNLVVESCLSIAHAEVVALSLAQRKLGSYDLSAIPGRRFALASSTEPCAMCLGAVLWSGVTELACGARDEDARAIGFDEGPKVANWIAELERRGISVARDICRVEAQAVLQEYLQGHGKIYNAHSNPIAPVQRS